jgi:hypothetical protein
MNLNLMAPGRVVLEAGLFGLALFALFFCYLPWLAK